MAYSAGTDVSVPPGANHCPHRPSPAPGSQPLSKVLASRTHGSTGQVPPHPPRPPCHPRSGLRTELPRKQRGLWAATPTPAGLSPLHRAPHLCPGSSHTCAARVLWGLGPGQARLCPLQLAGCVGAALASLPLWVCRGTGCRQDCPCLVQHRLLGVTLSGAEPVAMAPCLLKLRQAVTHTPLLFVEPELHVDIPGAHKSSKPR